jgi:TRAP-type C4-dicarboxylate transport system substrate-binding protein
MPSFIPGSSQAALDFVQTMEWDTPETATILQKEWEDINLKLLAYSAAGENGIVAKEVFESLDDLDGKKLGGSGTTGPAWAKKGVTQITVQFPDIYESLSRGVIDMTTMSLGAIVDMKWYEVTSVYMTYGTYPYSAPIMVNLDVWNGLPSDIQQLFMDAAQAARQFSLEYDAETTISSKQLFEDAGLEVGALPEEEQEWLYREFMQIWKADNMALAEKSGKLKEAEIIWEHSEKLVNEILAK